MQLFSLGKSLKGSDCSISVFKRGLLKKMERDKQCRFAGSLDLMIFMKIDR